MIALNEGKQFWVDSYKEANFIFFLLKTCAFFHLSGVLFQFMNSKLNNKTKRNSPDSFPAQFLSFQFIKTVHLFHSAITDKRFKEFLITAGTQKPKYHFKLGTRHSSK